MGAIKPAVEMIIWDGKKVLLIKREGYPFKGMWKFPGGMVDDDETVEMAAVREANEETGLDVEITDILGVYSDPKRDPRMHSMAIVFIMKPLNHNLKMNNESTEIKWIDINEVDMKNMGFDHGKIMEDFKEWLRDGGTYWTTKTVRL